MKTNMMNINGTLWMPKYDDDAKLWYIDIDGQAYSAQTIEALEAILRRLGFRVFRYPAR
jgi:hypothetical protein